MAARDSNAMSNLQYRLLGGEQVLPLIGAEQTTSSLVVMIFYEFVTGHIIYMNKCEFKLLLRRILQQKGLDLTALKLYNSIML